MRSTSGHVGDKVWVFNLEFLEIRKFILRTNFFTIRTGSGGPTDHEIRANEFARKPKSCATGWVENFDFRTFVQKLSLVIGVGL